MHTSCSYLKAILIKTYLKAILIKTMYHRFIGDITVQKLTNVHGDDSKGNISNK